MIRKQEHGGWVITLIHWENKMTDNIGFIIAQRITTILESRGLSYEELSEIIYGEFNSIAEDLKIGDWIEFPNGTKCICVFKP
ncbi:MAG: hypothetical protein RBR32_10320 [Bacteroidales bacterium]|nr:hypothetical protein [Bacteroidales bacterium]